MKFWVAQDDTGLIHLFNKKPKRMFIPALKLYQWCVENGTVICINNDLLSERYISDEKGNVEHKFLADIIGFKRKGYVKGVLAYEGIYTKEAMEVEIEFNIKLIKPKF